MDSNEIPTPNESDSQPQAVAGQTVWAPDPLVLGTLSLAAVVALAAVLIQFVPYLIGIGCVTLAVKIALSLRRIEQLRSRMLSLKREFNQRRALYDRALTSAGQLSEHDRQLAEKRLQQLQAYGLELLREINELLDDIAAAKQEVLADLGEASDDAIARRLAPFSEVEAEIGRLIEQIEANFLD